jgi:hypothetical protein
MDKTQFLLALLSSAAVGALVSTGLTAFTQWRERTAQRENMLLTLAVDLSKVYVGRVASMKGNELVMEMSMIPQFQRMLKDVIRTGGLSKQHRNDLMNYMDVKKMVDDADARETRKAEASKQQTEGETHG